jgi:large subunit ribosomal protein L4
MKKISKQEKAKTKVIKRQLAVQVYDIEGKEQELVKLPKKIFDITASANLVAQYIRVYLANQKQGTQSTKTRGEVKGSTRKIYRQKGTGRARHGDIKAPIFVGGGIAHGPKPRDLSLKINKKQKRNILLYVISQRFREGDIYFVDGLLKIKPKTQELISILKNLKLDKEKSTRSTPPPLAGSLRVGNERRLTSSNVSILLIYPKEGSNNLVLAARNIDCIELNEVGSINAYQILKSQKIIFTKETLPVLISLYSDLSSKNSNPSKTG